MGDADLEAGISIPMPVMPLALQAAGAHDQADRGARDRAVHLS
jgi:hypothetical protein